MEEPGPQVSGENEDEKNAGGEQSDARKDSKRISVRSSSAKEGPQTTVRSSIKEEHEGDDGESDVKHRLSRSSKAEQAQESTIQEEENTEGEKIKDDPAEGEDGARANLKAEQPKDEQLEGEQVLGEIVEGEEGNKEEVNGEHVEEEQLIGEMGEEHIEEEGIIGEHIEGQIEQEDHTEEEEILDEQKPEEIAKKSDEEMVEEEVYVEEPPPDPAAPYNFSDSKEAIKEPYELRPDQMAEVEQLWEIYQNYTPAYTDIDGYITVKELCYMLRCLLIYPFTEEQLYELIDFAVRPPHPDGHVSFEQFVKIVKLRQRDFPQEEELRLALQVFDPEKSGILDRDNLKDVLLNKGHKISEKIVMSLVKEVDLTNDGTLGVEDIVGTMAIDMNRDDIILMQSTLNTLQEQLEGLMGVAIRRNDDDEDGGND